MRMLKRLGAVALILVAIVSALALWQREKVARLIAVNTLFAEEHIVHNFSHMGELFETREVPRAGQVRPLPQGAPLERPDGFDDWLARRGVTGIVVLKDGRRVLEEYRLGTTGDDLRISWSVAKSYLSMLFGVILETGAIESLDDPVTAYAPALEGSAYEGVSIRNVLQMSSGVEFDEDYLDFWSDINKMGRVLALGGSMDDFAAGLDERVRPAGEAWQYVSIDTHVLSMVLRGATGKSLPDLLSEHVIGPMGVESDPYYLTDGYGVAFALGGLNLTTRDYARMGQVVLNGGTLGGARIVSEAWLAESTAPVAPTEPGATGYGYQWWSPAPSRNGEVLARGVYGQYVWVDRDAGVVVAVNGADRSFRDPGAFEDALAMFRRLADLTMKGT